MTIREQLATLEAAPPGSSWFVRLIWALIDVNEPLLEEMDVSIADVIWGNGHTISWNLGRLVVAGDPKAIEICLIIADFMGPDHCVNAYEHGT
jgi:hypothetical protein